MPESDPFDTKPNVLFEGPRATGGNSYLNQNLIHPEALLAGIQKILEASKEREKSERFGADLKALVQDLNTKTKLYEESRAQLEAKTKEVERLRQREKEVAERKVVLDKLDENFEEGSLAHKESEKVEKLAAQSLAEANEKNAGALQHWVALSLTKDHELRVLRERENLSAKSLESAKKIWEEEKKELQDRIRYLEAEIAGNPPLDVATEANESGEKLKQLQADKERLMQTIAKNAQTTKENEKDIHLRKEALGRSLDEEDEQAFQNSLCKAETKQSEHRMVCEKAENELRECEERIEKELQKQNTASSSSKSADSQSSVDTSATTITTLTRNSSDHPEIEAKPRFCVD